MLSVTARTVVNRALSRVSHSMTKTAAALCRPNSPDVLVLSGVRGVAAYSRGFTGSVLRMCCSSRHDADGVRPIGMATTCTCGCSRRIHTENDKELVKFLEEEIKAETQTQKSKTTPTSLEGFDVKTDGSEIELRKKLDDENIIIKLNVNNSVDADEPEGGQEEGLQMKSKPNFTVEIEKKDFVVSFHCAFMEEHMGEEDYNDAFSITELSVYKGDWKDSNYIVSGDIMDGYLYDLLMNTLDERGITNNLVNKLEEFCTSYEHNQYINLLNNLKTIFSK